LSPAAKPLADYYDASYASLEYWDDEATTRRALEPIVLAAARWAPPGSTLLDVGSGAGAFLTLAADAGFRVTGLELNPRLAERARQRSGSEVVVGDVESEALGSRRFDVITLLDLIEHLLDPVAVLRRCHRWLAPGGHIIVYTPNHSSLIVRVADALYRLSGGRMRGPVSELFDCLHTVFFDPRTLRLALEQAGFATVQTQMLRYDPDRSRAATGVSAAVLRGLETVSPLVGGPFRVLMVGRAVEPTPAPDPHGRTRE
jgi:2-polyprenyl-3-methyl-5-hydroxy-6-metoxy-1,4-benzoquinol methylase